MKTYQSSKDAFFFSFFLVRSIIVPKCHRNSFEEEEMQTETGEEG